MAIQEVEPHLEVSYRPQVRRTRRPKLPSRTKNPRQVVLNRGCGWDTESAHQTRAQISGLSSRILHRHQNSLAASVRVGESSAPAESAPACCDGRPCGNDVVDEVNRHCVYRADSADDGVLCDGESQESSRPTFAGRLDRLATANGALDPSTGDKGGDGVR